MIQAGTAAGAVVMAAVTGDLDGVPGVVVLQQDASVMAGLAAIHQARADRNPVVVLAPRTAGDDQRTILGQVTKGTAASFGDGVVLAMAGPRGPVHVPFAGREIWPGDGWCPGLLRPGDHDVSPPVHELDAAARLVADSVHPVVVVGLEARSAEDAEWVRAFAEALPAPVVTTAKGRGVLPEPHPLALGQLDGPGAAVLDRADLVVALGVDPVELDGQAWPPATPVLRVRRSRIARPVATPGVDVVAGVALTLEELAGRLRDRTRTDWDVAELDRIRRRVVAARSATGRPGAEACAVRTVALARQLTPPRTIAAFERRWLGAASAWECVTPGDLLHPRPPGLGGFAVPATLAAGLARPGAPVLAFVDAAALAAALPELDTARRLSVPVVIVILDGLDPRLGDLVRALGVRVVAGPRASVLPPCLGALETTAAPLVVAVSEHEAAPV